MKLRQNRLCSCFHLLTFLNLWFSGMEAAPEKMMHIWNPHDNRFFAPWFNAISETLIYLTDRKVTVDMDPALSKYLKRKKPKRKKIFAGLEFFLSTFLFFHNVPQSL